MARHAVQGEVYLLVEALDQDRVPVLIVQEISQRDGDVSATGISFSIVCGERERETEFLLQKVFTPLDLAISFIHTFSITLENLIRI